jgi:hypothetical protein
VKTDDRVRMTEGSRQRIEPQRGAMGIPGVPIAPRPDGEIDRADRQQITGVYPGILTPAARYIEAGTSIRTVEIGFALKRTVSVGFRP